MCKKLSFRMKENKKCFSISNIFCNFAISFVRKDVMNDY